MPTATVNTFHQSYARYVVPADIRRLGDRMIACDRLSKRYQKIFLGGVKALKMQIKKIEAEREFWTRILNYYPELKTYDHETLTYNPKSGCIEINP